jgi:hypothetical protein
VNCPIQIETLFRMRYFFAKLLIEYLFQDERINPIDTEIIHESAQEFVKRPSRLVVSIGWVKLEGDSGRARINIFGRDTRRLHRYSWASVSCLCESFLILT